MPQNIPPRKMKQICQEIYEGDFLQATHLYKEASGKGLKESREFIRVLTTRLQDECPEKFPAQQAASGHTGCTAALLVLIVLAMWLFA